MSISKKSVVHWKRPRVKNKLLAQVDNALQKTGAACWATDKQHGRTTNAVLAQKHLCDNWTIEGMDMHKLAQPMENSVVMIERHYSKLTATMAADRLVLGEVYYLEWNNIYEQILIMF